MGAIPWAPQLQNGDVAAKVLMLDFDGLGHFLQPAAARSLRAFANEFESVFGVAFTISEAFRDLPTQYFYYDLYIDGDGNMAAVPGTSSHGQGLAVDINSWVYGNSSNTARHRWLVENAPRFGWSWELVGKGSNEPWHFNYVGGWSDWADVDITPISNDWLDMATEDETRNAMHDGMKGALLEVLPGILAALPKPTQNLQLVFGAGFASGDTTVNGIGQATAENSPAGSDWGNFFLIDWDANTYTWVVTPGKIRQLVGLYGNGQGGYDRVDAAFFIGMKNGFSRDAITGRPGE